MISTEPHISLAPTTHQIREMVDTLITAGSDTEVRMQVKALAGLMNLGRNEDDPEACHLQDVALNHAYQKTREFEQMKDRFLGSREVGLATHVSAVLEIGQAG